jgi:hypothetical protein
MKEFLLGAATMGFATAGLFFFRFWHQTRDRLFLIFALSFWMLGLNRIVQVMIGSDQREFEHYFFVVRLVAYLLIIVAILDKNRSTSDPGPSP